MTAQLNIPTLRFPGFEGDFTYIKIGDYTISSAFGPRFSSDLYSELGEIVTLRTTDMDLDGKINYDQSPKASIEITQIEDHILLEGDLVVSRSGTIGITGIFEGYKLPVIPGAFLIRFRLNSEKLLPKYIQILFNSDKGRNKIESLSAGGVQKNLTGTSILNLHIPIPTLPEQQKIASFLSKVDKKLTQLKKKKELLEQYKKGMMQKIFSQEIRFKIENEAGELVEPPEWDIFRLGEIAEFSKGKGISKSDIDSNGNNECIRYGELYTIYGPTIEKIVSRTNLDTKNLVLSEANDIIIPASGETEIDIATAACVLKSGVALGGDLNIIKTKNNGVFLSYYLNSRKKMDIATLAQGISVIHLYSKQLALLEMEIPCKHEQIKIANFLSSLDKKITHTQIQIEKAEQWKKGLLQQLFL